jgi:hypothetical protein
MRTAWLNHAMPTCQRAHVIQQQAPPTVIRGTTEGTDNYSKKETNRAWTNTTKQSIIIKTRYRNINRSPRKGCGMDTWYIASRYSAGTRPWTGAWGGGGTWPQVVSVPLGHANTLCCAPKRPLSHFIYFLFFFTLLNFFSFPGVLGRFFLYNYY